MRQTPRYHSKRPPIIVLGKRRGAKLASFLSVGDGAVSEASKGAIYIENFMPGMWVGTCFAQQQQNRHLDAGTGAGVPSLVGAASPGRRKLLQ